MQASAFLIYLRLGHTASLALLEAMIHLLGHAAGFVRSYDRDNERRECEDELLACQDNSHLNS